MAFSENLCWTLGLVATALVLLTGPAQGMLPPENIRERNLAAPQILIGLVEEVGSAPTGWRELLPPLPQGDPSVFTLNLTHAVKSAARLRPGERFKVLFVPEKSSASELHTAHAGWSAVRVTPGDLVIVYANHQEMGGQRLLLPVLAGLSVVRLTPPTLPKQNVPTPK